MSEVARLRATLALESRLASGLASAKAQMQAWVGSMRNWASPLSAISKREFETIARDASNLGRKLTLSLSLPLLALGGGAVKMAGSFDQALRNVNSIAQLSEKQFHGLHDAVLKLSDDPTIIAGPKELAVALYDVYSSGFQGEQALSVLKVGAQGAAAGLTDAATSGRVLMATLNSGISGVKDARTAMDVLFKTVDLGVLSFGDLANQLGDVLPTAKTAGVSLQEVGAAIATMTRQGISAAESVTALNQMMLHVIKPTDDQAKLMKQLGIEYGITALSAKGLSGWLDDVIKKTGGNKQALVQLMPEVRGLKGLLSLTTQEGKLYKDMLSGMAKSSEGAGATAKAAAQQQKGFENQLKLLRKELEKLAIEFGEDLIPILRKDVLPAVRDIFGWFKTLTPQTREWMLKISLLAIAFGPLLRVMGSIIGLRSAFVGAQVSEAAAVTATGEAAAASTVKLTGLRGILVSLGSRVWPVAIVFSVAVLLNALKEDFQQAQSDAIDNNKKAYKSFFDDAVNAATESIKKNGEAWARKIAGTPVAGFNVQQFNEAKKRLDYAKSVGAGRSFGSFKADADAADATKRAIEEARKQAEAFAKANAALTGDIGKGGSGGGHARAVKEVATEYDYWGRAIRSVAQDGFAPLRVSLADITKEAGAAENPLSRIGEQLKALLDSGDIRGARRLAENFVDSLAVSPKEIGDVVSSITSTIGAESEEMRAKLSAAIGDARNFSDSAKGVLIESAKLRDEQTKAAERAREAAQFTDSYRKTIAGLNAELAHLNATTDLQNALLDLQASEIWPKLDFWGRVGLALATARKIAIIGENEANRQRLEISKQLASTFASEVSGMRERIALQGKDTEMARLKYRLSEGDLKNLNAIQKAFLIIHQQTLDRGKQVLDFWAKFKEAIENTRRATEAGRETAKRYMDNLSDRLLELTGQYEKLARIQLSREITIGDPKEKQKAIDDIIAQKKIVEQAEILYGYLDRLSGGLTDIFMNMFIDIGKGWDTMFSNAKKGLHDLLNEMAAEIFRSQVKNFFLGVLNKVFGGGFLEARAEGGPVAAGRPYLVGERGPELFVPHGSGSVVSNESIGGTTINVGGITVYASGAEEGRQAANQIASDLGRLVAQNVRRDYGRTAR